MIPNDIQHDDDALDLALTRALEARPRLQVSR